MPRPPWSFRTNQPIDMNQPDPWPQRRSTRLPDYDYRSAGAYFITICSRKREMVFLDERVESIIRAVWEQVPVHFEHVRLDEFVVMPNHIHGILFITGGGRARHASPLPDSCQNAIADTRPGVRIRPAGDMPAERRVWDTKAPADLGTIVGSFKAASAKQVNDLRNARNAPVWQRNYYEHVIRNEEKLGRVRNYIRENPALRADDVYNPHRSQGSP